MTAIEFCLLETENRPVLPYSSMTQMLISRVDVLHSSTIPRLGRRAEEAEPTLSELDTSNLSVEIEPLLNDLNSSSSAAEIGPALDDPNISNWSLDIDLVFSVNTPDLPVEIAQILNEFNTSDLPARPTGVESTRSSSVENFTDTGST